MAGPFRGIEILFHAGDRVLPELDLCFPGVLFYAVCGNQDAPRAGLPEQRVVTVAGTRIAITHGYGSHADIERRVLEKFSHVNADVIIFGHTHRAVCRRVGSVLLLNPGSPTERRTAPFRSVGILHLADEVRAEIVNLGQ